MIAKGSGFVKGQKAVARGRLSAHLKYIEFRSREGNEHREDRYIFSKEQDHVSRREALNGTMEHTSRSVSFHKIVLSPGANEPVRDWQEWTRNVMGDLEERQGKELHWYAVHHENTEHPHVHVVLAGAGDNRETGKEEAVKLYPADFQALRAAGMEHSEHDWYQRIGEMARDGEEQEREQLEQSRHHVWMQRDDFDR
jgi:hypothetical protein